MSEQWYCPNCGPVTEVEFEDGDLYTVCVECCENVEDNAPPFVLAMQEEIAGLKSAVSISTTVINHLNERISELEAAQRWIPVSERLPNDNGMFICICKSGHVSTFGFNYLRGVFNWAGSAVTHWMPLPAPPEEQGE